MMNDNLKIFKEQLKRGDAVYGPFMKTGDAAFVECAGHAGFDFVILDMEHGPVGFSNLQNLIRGAETAGVLPIVRTYDSSETAIGKALDLGAKGVQVPQIQSVNEAREVVKAARYFPKGERGVCRFVRAAAYSSTPRNDYFNQANEALVILQVEGKQVLNHLDEILSVEGLDILFVGPYDLSQSLGVPGQVSHPEVVAAIRTIAEQAKQAGVTTGVFCDTFEAAALWREAGIQYLSYSVDVGVFTEACAKIVNQLKTQ
ncbi:MAG: aldolase [Dysgonamonadaceae bacterium]|jgi:4-hydroxy-2-oxoheptanedioate aldolase|nr:aldolase [Dysgonamonadaceae bacterium]